MIRPLYRTNGLFHALQFTVSFHSSLIRENTTLYPFTNVIVRPPFIVLQPSSFQQRNTRRTFMNRSIQRTSFTVRLVITSLRHRVFFYQGRAMQTITTRRVVNQTKGVVSVQVIFLSSATRHLISLFKQGAFIASTMGTSEHVTTGPFRVVFHVNSGRFQVVQVKSINQIDRPRILPSRSAITITDLVGLLITSRTSPIARRHGIRVNVMDRNGVVFTATVIRVQFARTPIATPTSGTATVSGRTRGVVILVRYRLTSASFRIFHVQGLVVRFRNRINVMRIQHTMAFEPPRTQIFRLRLQRILSVRGSYLLFSHHRKGELLRYSVSCLTFRHAICHVNVIILRSRLNYRHDKDHVKRQRSEHGGQVNGHRLSN